MSLANVQPSAAAGPSVLVAHRGLSDAAQVKYGIPEHSIAAYDWAIDHGAEVVDFDVQFTRDGKLLLMHNRTLNETTNKTGWVKNHTLDWIKSAWLELPVDRDGNGNDDNTTHHPPSLNQGLNFVQPKTVNGKPVMITLETKGEWSASRMQRLYDVVNSKGMRNRVILHSFNLDHVKWAKVAGFPIRGYVASTTLPTVETVRAYGSYVFVKLGILTAAKAQEYQAAGIKVAVWTLDNTAEYSEALGLGADLWICNDLPEAQEYLKAET